MKKIMTGLTALLLLLPLTAWSQNDGEPMTEAERQVLREELDQARKEVTRAARKVARIQRQLFDEGQRTHWIEREMETSEGFSADRIIFNHRGHLMRPRLGVLLGGGADKRDVVVGLTPGSGAEAAGIRPGDRLVAVNGRGVDPEDPESFRRPLEEVEPGDRVPVELERQGERLKLEVEVSSPMPGKRFFERRISRDGEQETEIMVISPDGEGMHAPKPPKAPKPPMPPRLGGLGRHSDMISNHAGLEPYFGTAEGVVVLRIDADNSLELEDGDVVLRVDGEAVSRPVEIGRALLGRRGETVTLEVMRAGEAVTIEAGLGEAKAVSALVRDLHPGI